jgi:DNA-binding IclR family transcriptional regulator
MSKWWAENGYCPSTQELADELGMSYGQTYRQIYRLAQEGSLERFQHYRGWRVTALPENKS